MNSLFARLRQKLSPQRSSRTQPRFRFSRPLIVFQSDDWGRVGVRDKEGWDELRASGVNLGEKPYDYYSLETADDLQALCAVLKKHRDSVGRHPCVGMNFITANVDFQHSLRVPGEIRLRPLTDGLPHPWRRPGLLEAYQEGIRDHLFFPCLHGLTHFSSAAIARELQIDGERGGLLHTLWAASTPYIHWRMPWIGYEYWDPSQPREQRFLPLADQCAAIQRAAEIFRTLFGVAPVSACAPGYRANHETKIAWFEVGIRVVQGGPDKQQSPSLDNNGMLHTSRNVEMEPATGACGIESIVKEANDCLARGMPAIVSVHSINFHSTIRDFRTPTLALLEAFLAAIEKQWPDLLYVHDGDLLQIVERGALTRDDNNVKIEVTAAK
jgi:hypothetical protein